MLHLFQRRRRKSGPDGPRAERANRPAYGCSIWA